MEDNQSRIKITTIKIREGDIEILKKATGFLDEPLRPELAIRIFCELLDCGEVSFADMLDQLLEINLRDINTSIK